MRKDWLSFAVKNRDRVLMLQETKLAANFERKIKDILDKENSLDKTVLSSCKDLTSIKVNHCY